MARRLSIGVLFGVLVFVTCVISISTRMPGTLAVFWPANALVLGLLLRMPAKASVEMWIGVAIGYLAADLLTGADLTKTLLLNSANVTGMLVGFYIFQRVRALDLSLSRGISVGWVGAIAALAAASAAVVGGVADVVLYDNSWQAGWINWFAYEFVNYTVILPLVLSFPTSTMRQVISERDWGAAPRALRHIALPLILFVASMVLGWLFGGLGALTFTMPSLIAAALLGDVFVTALFIAASTAWAITLSVTVDHDSPAVGPIPIDVATLIGLAFLAGGPLVIACVTAEQKRVYQALHRAMTRDDLTSALRRGEFVRAAELALGDAAIRREPSSLLMMDLDHFKRLNDTFGHAAGDRALAAFADVVRAEVGADALFARMGGEEFALLLAGGSVGESARIAENIRAGQQDCAYEMFGDIGATVSIGVASTRDSTGGSDALLQRADEALYLAKTSQRNTVVTQED